MKPPAFKPSEVILVVPPLVATMGHAGSQHAASLLVLGCQFHGDTWGPMSSRQVGEAIKWALEEKREPWPSLNRNPFFKPDIYELVSKGFARWTEEDGGTVAFTDEGLERLRRWVRAS